MEKGLYPSENQHEVAAALIWFKSGSPLAADRWRAAHTVMSLDTTIKGMYENGGRDKPGRRGAWGMTPSFHTYGEYLGWHGLFLAAGDFLSKTPVLIEHKEDAWQGWLERQLLTRKDGLWLADGTDSSPIDALVNLLEGGPAGITGKKEKILALIGIADAMGNEIVVDGNWHSYGGIDVSVYSSLVPYWK
jgi:hypothetical protein